MRELVESPRFGRGTLEDLAALEGVEPTDVDPDGAFELRAQQPPDEDSFTNRLEQALGAINGLVFRRRDHTAWGDRIDAALDEVGGLAYERLGDPWCEEILLELTMILLCRTFPTSRNEEVEKLRPLVARVEAILRAGCLIYGARGAALESATLLACPGPGEP